MPELIKSKGQVIATVTDFFEDYVTGLDHVIEESIKKRAYIGDVPSITVAMSRYPEILDIAKEQNIHTSTYEVRGIRCMETGDGMYLGHASYEVTQGRDLKITPEVLKISRDYLVSVLDEDLRKYANDLFYMSQNQWYSLFNLDPGSLDSKTYPRHSLEEVKKKNHHGSGTLFAYDSLHNPSIHSTGAMDRDAVMHDSRMLMIVGSPKNRKRFVDMRFESEENGGLGLDYIYNSNPLGNVGRDFEALARLEVPIAQPVYLNAGGGVSGGIAPGRFVLLEQAFFRNL